MRVKGSPPRSGREFVRRLSVRKPGSSRPVPTQLCRPRTREFDRDAHAATLRSCQFAELISTVTENRV